MHLLAHILFRVLFGLGALACLCLAALLVRAARRMTRRAKSRSLAALLPALLDPDMEDLVGLLQAKGGLHSPREPTRLKSTVIGNYLGAMLLTALGVFATAMVVRDLLGGR